jgi:signal transduction histidine kinase
LSGSGNGLATATIIETGRTFTLLLCLIVALLVVVAILSGVSIALSVATARMADQRFEQLDSRYAISEREARVLQERVADMKVELVKRGIPLSDH